MFELGIDFAIRVVNRIKPQMVSIVKSSRDFPLNQGHVPFFFISLCAKSPLGRGGGRGAPDPLGAPLRLRKRPTVGRGAGGGDVSGGGNVGPSNCFCGDLPTGSKRDAPETWGGGGGLGGGGLGLTFWESLSSSKFELQGGQEKWGTFHPFPLWGRRMSMGQVCSCVLELATFLVSR